MQFSQGIPFSLPQTAQLISTWSENKERFFKLFNDQLIWQSPEKIQVELTDEIKNNLIDTFLSQAYEILPIAEFDDFSVWINTNRKGFFENRIVYPIGESLTMKENGKLLRAFKHFAEGNKLRKLQDLASQFIQKNKIEGYLCLSIHPLDYLTASENNSNWRSCHALDGEYRAGNLSYMLDKTTFICYLYSGVEGQLVCMPEGMLWNDKKWRMYVSVNEHNEIVFFSRQYPFTCDNLLDYMVRESPLASLHLGRPRHDGFKKIVNGDGKTIELEHNYIYIRRNDRIFDTKDICAGHPNALNYNDLIMSPSYTPVFSISVDRWPPVSSIEGLKTVIGAEVPCLLCGNPIEDSNEFLCDHCWEAEIEGVIGHCCNCGGSLYSDDNFQELDNGDLLCEDCAYDRGL